MALTRLGNGIRSSLGAGPREEEQRRSAFACLSQLFKADAAVGTKKEREVFIRQWNSLQEFFARWKKNSEGNFAGTCSKYRDCRSLRNSFGNISVTFWRVR